MHPLYWHLGGTFWCAATSESCLLSYASTKGFFCRQSWVTLVQLATLYWGFNVTSAANIASFGEHSIPTDPSTLWPCCNKSMVQGRLVDLR